MAQQLLHGADVVAALQQVGSKGVAQRVRSGGLVDAGGRNRKLEDALEVALEQVVAPLRGGAWVPARVGLREDPMPGP